MAYIGRDALPKDLGDIANVDLDTIEPVNNDVLKFDGANWIAIQGAGSGLDADLLDGNEATAFATSSQGSLADSAVQPGDDADVLGAGDAADGTFLGASGGQAVWQNLPNVESLGHGGAAQGTVLTAGAAGSLSFAEVTAGDVSGPASSGNGNLAAFDGASGKQLLDSGVDYLRLSGWVPNWHRGLYDSVAGYTGASGAFGPFAKMPFATEVFSVSDGPGGGFYVAVEQIASGASNPNVAGYATSTVDDSVVRFDYSSETNNYINFSGTGPSEYLQPTANPEVAAYQLGAARNLNFELGGFKISFPSDTPSIFYAIDSNKVNAFNRWSISNPAVSAWFHIENENYATAAQFDYFTYKLDYATETVSVFKQTDTEDFDRQYRVENPAVAAYWLGRLGPQGQNYTYSAGDIVKFTFAAETESVIGSVPANNDGFENSLFYRATSMSNPGVNGYWFPEITDNNDGTTLFGEANMTAIRFSFATETHTVYTPTVNNPDDVSPTTLSNA